MFANFAINFDVIVLALQFFHYLSRFAFEFVRMTLRWMLPRFISKGFKRIWFLLFFLCILFKISKLWRPIMATILIRFLNIYSFLWLFSQEKHVFLQMCALVDFFVIFAEKLLVQRVNSTIDTINRARFMKTQNKILQIILLKEFIRLNAEMNTKIKKMWNLWN